MLSLDELSMNQSAVHPERVVLCFSASQNINEQKPYILRDGVAPQKSSRDVAGSPTPTFGVEKPSTPTRTRSMLTEELEQELDGALILPGHDSALVGVGSRCGMENVAIYDLDLLQASFMEQNDWTEEEAQEWIDFNVLGAYLGERTPLFMRSHAPRA